MKTKRFNFRIFILIGMFSGCFLLTGCNSSSNPLTRRAVIGGIIGLCYAVFSSSNTKKES